MWYWHGGGMPGWGFALIPFGMALLWAAVIIGIVALVRYTGRGGGWRASAAAQPSAPEQLLAERFARGEIDEDEYWRRLAALRGAGQAHAGS